MTLLLDAEPRAEATRHDERIEAPPLCTQVPADLAARRGLRDRLSRFKQRAALRASVPLSRVLGSRGNGFGILMYHRVIGRTAGMSNPTYNVEPRRFRAQLAGLLRRGYAAWPLRLVLEQMKRGEPVPRNVFVVTFDDGYENVFRHAFPILLELKVPATVFLATAYLGRDEPFPFDDWSAKGSARVPTDAWRPLSIVQCRAMQSTSLIELGTHTHTHADFRNRPEDLRRDLVESQDVLLQEFGLRDATFAFPYGTRSTGFSGPVLSQAAREAGTLCSLSTEEDLVLPGCDPFDWGRLHVHDDDTASTLAAKLDGWYGLFRGLWRRAARAS